MTEKLAVFWEWFKSGFCFDNPKAWLNGFSFGLAIGFHLCIIVVLVIVAYYKLFTT